MMDVTGRTFLHTQLRGVLSTSLLLCTGLAALEAQDVGGSGGLKKKE